MSEMRDQIKAVFEAIEIAGSQKALADIAKVPPSFVSQWVTERRPVPAKKCQLIEQGTGITCHRLRPDVFPAPEQQAKKLNKSEAA